MIKAICAGALAFAMASNAYAETIKRDIDGFETGMTFEQATAIAQKRGCKLQASPFAVDGTGKGVRRDRNYLCSANVSDMAKGVGLSLQFGAYSGKLLSITKTMTSKLSLARFAADICKHYTTDCATPLRSVLITDDPDEQIRLSFFSAYKPNIFGFALHNIKLHEAEDEIPRRDVTIPSPKP